MSLKESKTQFVLFPGMCCCGVKIEVDFVLRQITRIPEEIVYKNVRQKEELMMPSIFPGDLYF